METKCSFLIRVVIACISWERDISLDDKLLNKGCLCRSIGKGHSAKGRLLLGEQTGKLAANITYDS